MNKTKDFDKVLEKKRAYETSLENFVKLLKSNKLNDYHMIKHIFENVAELYNENKKLK